MEILICFCWLYFKSLTSSKKSWHHGSKDSVQEDYEEGMGQVIPPEGREGRAFVHSGAEEGVGGHMDGGRGGKHENN